MTEYVASLLLDWCSFVDAGFRIRIRVNLSCWICIQIQGGKNYPRK